jgi:GT2 family glycosyltransferase
MRIAVLMTCHNRRETTLTCLKNLYDQDLDFDVYLVDDGSTDGTGKAVKQHFPEINVITGNGTLFWNRGMRMAWQHAMAQNISYTHYIWLNDDTLLHDHALSRLLAYSKELQDKHIICAAINDPLLKTFTYGGKDVMSQPVPPNGSLQRVHYMNGNLVLVPKYVVDTIGVLDAHYRHHLGDYDYGLRAAKNNIQVYTTPEYIGSCESNKALKTRGRKPGTTLTERFRFLYSPLGVDPIAQFIYQKRHDGLLIAIKNFTVIHINNLLSNGMRKFYADKIKKESD